MPSNLKRNIKTKVILILNYIIKRKKEKRKRTAAEEAEGTAEERKEKT